MNRISDLEENQRDFDWFIIGVKGEIIHLTSGGGILPVKVKKSRDDLEFLLYYFKSLPIINSNQNYNKFGYNDYAEMTRRGLFTYERFDYLNNDDTRYKKVYSPNSTLLLCDISNEIQALLKGLELEINPRINNIIDIAPLL